MVDIENIRRLYAALDKVPSMRVESLDELISSSSELPDIRYLQIRAKELMHTYKVRVEANQGNGTYTLEDPNRALNIIKNAPLEHKQVMEG